MKRVQDRLEREFARSGKTSQFETLRGFVTGELEVPYHKIAAQTGTTEGAVKVAVHRLRRRFREVLRDEVAQTVSNASDVDEEIRYLFGALHSEPQGLFS